MLFAVFVGFFFQFVFSDHLGPVISLLLNFFSRYYACITALLIFFG